MENIDFASVSNVRSTNVTITNLRCSINDIVLTTEDTTLCVNNQKYCVAFPLVSQNGDLIHIDSDVKDYATYSGNSTFNVTAENISFELPLLTEGTYTVVSYIATDEGIRISKCTPLIFNSHNDTTLSKDRTQLTVNFDEDGVATVSYTKTTDCIITLSSAKNLTYSDFYSLCCETAFQYETPTADLIEMNRNGSYVALQGTETTISNGTYRMKYSFYDDTSVTEGYIYFEFNN